MRSILTPRQLAEAIGVSESSVKRWVDDGHIAATRTAGGHRRIAISEAVRYVRERRVPVIRPEVLGLDRWGPQSPQGGDFRQAGARLFEYLRSGAAVEARGLIQSLFLDGATVAEIVDGPLSAAMTRIGELWVDNPSGVFWEHRATQIAIESMSRLRSLLAPGAEAPVAVGGAPSGDRYILPSLAAAAVLEGEGLRAVNLGPETPLETLALGVLDLQAPLAWLSVSFVEDAARLRRQIHDWAVAHLDRGTILVVGGAQAPSLGLARSDGLYVGRSMAELEALVRGMRLAGGPLGASS